MRNLVEITVKRTKEDLIKLHDKLDIFLFNYETNKEKAVLFSKEEVNEKQTLEIEIDNKKYELNFYFSYSSSHSFQIKTIKINNRTIKRSLESVSNEIKKLLKEEIKKHD